MCTEMRACRPRNRFQATASGTHLMTQTQMGQREEAGRDERLVHHVAQQSVRREEGEEDEQIRELKQDVLRRDPSLPVTHQIVEQRQVRFLAHTLCHRFRSSNCRAAVDPNYSDASARPKAAPQQRHDRPSELSFEKAMSTK